MSHNNRNGGSNPGNIMHQNFASLEEDFSIATPPVVQNNPVKPVTSPANNGKIVFNGFQHTVKMIAKQEVFLPLSQVRVRVSPIQYSEEAAMAQSFLNPQGILTELVKLIYAHIVDGPERMTKSFDAFIDNTTQPDLAALVYGFHLTSYGSIVTPVEEIKCKNCGKPHTFKSINIADYYQEEQFIGDEFAVLDYTKIVDLSDNGLPGVSFELKIPTIRKTMLMEEGADPTNLAMSQVERYISKLMIKSDDGGITEFSDQKSIHNAVASLPPVARKKLLPIIRKDFQKYGVKFDIPWTCNLLIDDVTALGGKKNCNTENIYSLKVENTFFRQVFTALLDSSESDDNSEREY